MVEFIQDLKYMCSADNTKSRGLYIFITVALIAMAIGIVGGIVGIIYTAIKGGSVVLMIILTLVIAAIFAGTIFWLIKS